MIDMNLQNPTIKITGAAVLAPLAVILQIVVPFLITPWGMRIDFVAIPWILCWIIFGFKPALLSLLISAPLVGFLGPFAGGWVGAVMKSAASIWMFLIPAIFAWKAGGTEGLLKNKGLFALAGVSAIIVRVVVTLLFNFYLAIPFFFNMTPNDIIGFFSGVTTLGFIGLGAYITEVAFWNIIQGIIDLLASLIIGLIILRRFPALTENPANKKTLENSF
jgi:riboflavin transporter FmnP